eukprot:SAG22_NODE_9488_length_587_cov_1.059426_1_plen_33_part_10
MYALPVDANSTHNAGSVADEKEEEEEEEEKEEQ